jgi:hypothetical protein
MFHENLKAVLKILSGHEKDKNEQFKFLCIEWLNWNFYISDSYGAMLRKMLLMDKAFMCIAFLEKGHWEFM